MAVCEVCKNRFFLRRLNARLDIPEYRSMTGFWPWLEVRVCDGCLQAYEVEFMERLRLLAPEVLENDEPIAQEVCLACGTIQPRDSWRRVSRWVAADGRAARRATFYLCPRHEDLPYVEGIVVSSNLADVGRMNAVLDELPVAGAALLARVEGWRPETGQGPAAALDFKADRTRDGAAQAAMDFWTAAPDGLDAKAAWLGPIRKDYKLRYRLDLVRDFADGRREALVIVRLGRDHFATYRTAGRRPPKHP
jgi:hypothetical protein